MRVYDCVTLFGDDFDIISVPEDVEPLPGARWLENPMVSRLWLPKEKIYAYVIVPYFEERNASIGTIDIRVDNRPWHDRWSTTASGRGFDGSRILLPVKDDSVYWNPIEQKIYIENAINEMQSEVDRFRHYTENLNLRLEHLNHLSEIQDIIE